MEAWQIGKCRAGKWSKVASKLLGLKLLGPHLDQNVQLDVAALAPALCTTHSRWKAVHSGKDPQGVWWVRANPRTRYHKKQPNS